MIEEELESDKEINLMNTTIECLHKWQRNREADNVACYLCNWYPVRKLRAKCLECYKEVCIKCLEEKNFIEKEEINIEILKERIEMSEIRILRKRIQSLEEMQKLMINKIEMLGYNKGKTIEIEEQSKECLQKEYVQVVCNPERLKNIKVKCYIRIGQYEIKCLELIDSRCSNCIINKTLIPKQYIVQSKNPIEAQQMDGELYTYTELVQSNSKISFETLW